MDNLEKEVDQLVQKGWKVAAGAKGRMAADIPSFSPKNAVGFTWNWFNPGSSHLQRFYIEKVITGNTLLISDPDTLHHIRDVLRLKPDDAVTVFDIEGTEYSCLISSLDRKAAALDIRSRNFTPLRKRKIAIACAIPKKSKMDDIIDKLTQLDVDVIIPMETERVIIKLEDSGQARLERWNKIARSAAEQSQRNTLPEISAVSTFQQVLKQAVNYELKLIPALAGERKNIREILKDRLPSSIIALVGPEGDFTAEEIEAAFQNGCIPVSLGKTVLRVETAAITVAGYLKLALSE